jgi:hypothetical protein
MFRRWAEGTIQSILGAVIIGCIPAAIIIRLVRIQSSWSGPVMVGLCAFTLTMISILALDAIRRLPPKRVIPNLKNIERCVRDWLDNFRYSVQKSPLPTAYFRFLVTVDSGTKMYIGRPRESFEDYILIRSEIKPTDAECQSIENLSEENRKLLILHIRLEMERRHLGYSNLGWPTSDPIVIFKRIPIREILTEHEFIAAIDEVEAAVHCVGTVFSIALIKAANFRSIPAN